jgi:hypothetical protein
LSHAISGLFQPGKGSSKARNFEVINSLQHVFEKWVEHWKKYITCQGRYLKEKKKRRERETITTPSQNKVIPQTLQTALVCAANDLVF